MKNNITVAICIYNCGRYIEETLMCIVNQTYQEFDLLIVNDCSTDSSVDKVKAFFEINPRPYELVNFEENKGIGYARHFSERYAKTKYMLFIDADDLPYTSLVEKLYNKITRDNDLMAVGCYLEYIDKNGKKIGGGLFIGEKNKEDFIEKAKNNKLIFMQPTAIYDRELALSVGGYIISGFPKGKPRYQDYCEDLDLWTRMSDLFVDGKAIIVVPEILCGYRKHETGMSSNTLSMILKIKYVKSNLLRRRAGEKEQTFIEFYDSITPQQMRTYKKGADAAVYLREGVFALKKGNLPKAIYKISYSIILQPSYIIQKIKNNLIK